MPVVKTDIVSIKNEAGDFGIKITFKVNSAGEFYCGIPELLADAYIGRGTFTEQASRYSASGRIINNSLFSSTLDGLYAELREALLACHTPKISKETVILYNLESHVSFAVDDDNAIVPNAGYPNGARWINSTEDAQFYGKHHATRPAVGGYSLTIGAVAMTKTTVTLGERPPKVSYLRYYGENGHNLGKNTPAERLNSWVSFTLPENPKEMPYSDEAADFFYRLMHGMASLSRMIQERTGDQERLLQLIENCAGFPLLGAPTRTND